MTTIEDKTVYPEAEAEYNKNLFNPDPIDCQIDFYRQKIDNYKVDYYNKEYIFSIRSTSSNIFKKSHVLDYIFARFSISEHWL